MKVEEFDYDLPERLIAQKPIENRDESRLMILNKETGEINEKIFYGIVDLLNKEDLLILNNSKVIPARLYGEKVPTGTDIEVLLLTRLNNNRWEVLVKPGKRVKKGVKVSFGNGELVGKAVEYTEFGGRIMEFEYEGEFEKILDKLGRMPLPPYIKEDLDEPERYQTVYAEKRGSVAAPTAGLHFTPELLIELRDRGVRSEYVTLHVGLDTFQPVREEHIEDHDMHTEVCLLPPEVAQAVNETKLKGRRVVAVGTTSVRVLETAAQEAGGAACPYRTVAPFEGETDLFIYPGYDFRAVDALVTNFHLPRSTLLMLVAAFAGKDLTERAYAEAVERAYRFYSFGDAMLIL